MLVRLTVVSEYKFSSSNLPGSEVHEIGFQLLVLTLRVIITTDASVIFTRAMYSAM